MTTKFYFIPAMTFVFLRKSLVLKDEKKTLVNFSLFLFLFQEALKKFPDLEKRSEYFINVSLQIKNQFDSKKALIAKWLPGISPQEANNIKRLQIETERMSNSLYSLLNKLQVLALNSILYQMLNY